MAVFRIIIVHHRKILVSWMDEHFESRIENIEDEAAGILDVPADGRETY